MEKTANQSLITDLFDNFAVAGPDYRICYIGDSFRKLFEKNNLIEKPEEDTKYILKSKILRESIDRLQEEGDTEFVEADENDIKCLIFSSGHPGGEVIIASDEKVSNISHIKHALQERVKELRCLFDVTVQLESSEPFNIVLSKLTKIIEDGFQYPDKTFVNIIIRDKKYGRTDWHQDSIRSVITSEIELGEGKKGKIYAYLQNDEGFLKEEKSLLDEISGKITRSIERNEKTKDLEKQRKILLAKNEALLRLTEECNQRRQKLRTFFRAITDKIVVIDKEYNIIMSNKDDIGESGKCYKKLFNLDSRCEECPAVETFTTASDQEAEKQMGRNFFMLNAYPIFNSKGDVDRVLEVCKDISDQKILEGQLIQSYKLASLGKLVAGVAHEINNPNTFILGNLKIVQESLKDIFPILDEVYKEKPDLKIARLNYEFFKENINVLVEDMLKGANRTKKIVGDLRNFAKKDEGTLEDTVDINHIIMNNLTITSKQIKKYADLKLDLEPNLPTFRGNINRLEQVLLNLTLNASEAIENGNGFIEIKTSHNKADDEIILTISDNGCGMSEEVVKNIFDPFFTTKRNRGGTGLGLSISYGIIKDHKGSIEVKSSPGEGTKFIIHIPVKSR